MTVTISRLYDNYADAQRAVTRLEAAGLPQADLSIVANNSDNWYGADKKGIVIATAQTIAPKALLPVLASAPVSAEWRACLPGSACSRFRGWGRWSQLGGWRPRRSAPRLAPRPAAWLAP